MQTRVFQAEKPCKEGDGRYDIADGEDHSGSSVVTQLLQVIDTTDVATTIELNAYNLMIRDTGYG